MILPKVFLSTFYYNFFVNFFQAFRLPFPANNFTVKEEYCNGGTQMKVLKKLFAAALLLTLVAAVTGFVYYSRYGAGYKKTCGRRKFYRNIRQKRCACC